MESLTSGNATPPRPFDVNRDAAQVARLWVEAGWLDPIPNEHKAFGIFMAAADSSVVEVDGHAECVLSTLNGTIRLIDEDIPVFVVAMAATGRIMRKRGLALSLVGDAIAREAEAGVPLSMLGMFEQGAYDKLGFGTGAYQTWHQFSPAQLSVPVPTRKISRLGLDDWERIHASRRSRKLHHGAVNIDHPAATHRRMLVTQEGFGLGFVDDAGRLTHHFWIEPDGDRGPYDINWLAWQNGEQLRELLGLIKMLEDQVLAVRLMEPPGCQIQSMLRNPFGARRETSGSRFAHSITARAWWQARICNLEAFVSALRIPTADFSFNVRLTDPIAKYLGSGRKWRGLAGDWTLHLGKESHARSGATPDRPQLRCSVNSLSRLLLGVGPASGLAVTDPGFSAPAMLLQQLDSIPIPTPSPDWYF